ncbi:MAG TPA: nucleoid-associated protein [Chitinophagaceae bacterium]|nr:nucleoid-associated protein [Chitinophagaceae bacterium]
MLDYTNCNIDRVAAHQVGNKNNDEELVLSKSLLDISDSRLRELLMRFFLSHFSFPELYSFTFTNGDFSLNPLFNYASQIFDSVKSFHKNSVNIAKHLYEVSVHPQIKSCDLFVTYFSQVSINDELVDAIGIFKSENKQSFLKLAGKGGEFILKYEDGISIEKLDKGCLIFNTDQKNGFKVAIIGKSNKSAEAQFWKDNFLLLRSCNDEYHYTKNFLSVTKDFIVKKLSEDFEISKADKIELLNKSVGYFKEHDTFNVKDFEKEVFKDSDMIKSFRKFGSSYLDNNDIDIADSFEISSQAVKKQAKSFKSVIKLDKNFHIYIHGDREMIEQGYDAKTGKKFYKIYFDQEF